MSRHSVILDVDTGHDDAVAIMMAAASPEIDLVAITVTAGNQYLPKTLANTLNVCSELSIDTPVYPGMTAPLLRDLVPAPLIHGESGLDGPIFGPCAKKAEKEHAARFIVDAVMSAPPGTITIVAVAPLTNVAMAIKLEPLIALRLSEIVVMGGSMRAGNVTPSAEFNIHADPESAAIVFSSGARVTMLGLDVTTRVVLTAERLDFLSRLPGKAASLFSASMRHYSAACQKYAGECPALHDPSCVAYAIDPSIVQKKFLNVRVECAGALTLGRTVVDESGVSGLAPNVYVAVSYDADRFWPLLEASLLKYRG